MEETNRKNKLYRILNGLNWFYLILVIIFITLVFMFLILNKFFSCKLGFNNFDWYPIFLCKVKNVEDFMRSFSLIILFSSAMLNYYNFIAWFISIFSFLKDFKEIKMKKYSFKLFFKKVSFYSLIISTLALIISLIVALIYNFQVF